MTALRASRHSVTGEVLFFLLLLFVSSLNFLELRRQFDRLNANGGGFGPGASPSADRAAERFFHGAHSGRWCFWAQALGHLRLDRDASIAGSAERAMRRAISSVPSRAFVVERADMG